MEKEQLELQVDLQENGSRAMQKEAPSTEPERQEYFMEKCHEILEI